MKKIKKISISLALLAVVALNFTSCKDNPKEANNVKSPEITKYAKFSAAIYSDEILKKYAASLSKTEPVSLNGNSTVEIKKKQVEVSSVTLSDGTKGYIRASYLADHPIVFNEDTKAYVRNNTSSKVYVTVPKGTIGFILSERAEWSQIYIGKVNGKGVYKQWVKSGFVKDEETIGAAKIYEEALNLYKKATKQSQKDSVIEKLKSLESSALFGELVKAKLETMSGEEKIVEEEVDMTGKAIVTAKAGLKMREKPSSDGKLIVVIPTKGIVVVGQKGQITETIAGKTSSWYEVSWNGKKGWVFGGFLDIK